MRIICRHCKQTVEARRSIQKYCDDLCYSRAYQARRRARMKKPRSTAPTISCSRSLEEEWYMSLLLPLGYKMNEVRVCYLIGAQERYFLLDFALEQEKINIEIDGPKHRPPTKQIEDWKRDYYLKKLGWTVIRIRNFPLCALAWPFVGRSSGIGPVPRYTQPLG